MLDFLHRKNVTLSPKVYLIDALGAMAFGLFATLLIGTILNSLGNAFNIPLLTERLWPLAKAATGPAIAVAIGTALGAPNLVLFAATVVGLGAYELGGPVGVYVATIVAVEFGKVVSKETKLDIIITPAITVIVGILIGDLVGPGVSALMTWIGDIIIRATELQPLLMGSIVSVLMGIALTLPISSAAISMMLGLTGLAGGAATIGCSAQMIGFAVISYRDNGLEGSIAQGLGTSMLQMPNIIRNPKVWIPPTLASAIIGPLGTVIFHMDNNPLGSGMGTSGLVGQISTLNTMAGTESMGSLLGKIFLLHFLLPGLLSYFLYRILYKRGIIKEGDLKIDL